MIARRGDDIWEVTSNGRPTGYSAHLNYEEDIVMELLRQGVPLTLLIDLIDPWGPRSAELYGQEQSSS